MPRLSPARVVALLAAMLGAVAAMGLASARGLCDDVLQYQRHRDQQQQQRGLLRTTANRLDGLEAMFAHVMDVKRAVLLLASVALAMLLVNSAPLNPAPAQAAQKPNIVFVFTDDQDAETFRRT